MKTPLNVVEKNVLEILERNFKDNRGASDTLTDIQEFIRRPRKFLIYECLSCGAKLKLPVGYFVISNSIPNWTTCLECYATDARYADTITEGDDETLIRQT